MSEKPSITMRGHLLNEFLIKGSSVLFQDKVLNRLASIPEEQREAEAEHIIQMMNTMSEKEVLENL